MQERVENVERALRQDRDHMTLDRLKEIMEEKPGDFEKKLEKWEEEYGEEILDDLKEWLEYYVDATKCPACLTEASVEWAVVHGEAQCISCGYPATIYHYAHRMSEDVERDDTDRIAVPLWVHPEQINLDKMREEA